MVELGGEQGHAWGCEAFGKLEGGLGSCVLCKL